jgi:hypothetical protein
MNISLNIITTTMGRETFPILIESFYNNLNENDFFTVISDKNHDFVEDTLTKYDFKCTVIYIKDDSEPSKYRNKYGHDLINKFKSEFKGDFLMFADDDDHYVKDAINFVRKEIVDLNTMYIFKHKWGLNSHWTVPIVNNIGKCMVSIPNIKENLPYIIEDVTGDFYWFPELEKIFNVKFIDKIIYLVRDTEL